METKDYWLPSGYQALRSLSRSSHVLLCRENASERLLVVKFRSVESSFRREARSLAQVADFDAAPRLLFATQDPNARACGPYYLGLEYRHGKSLLDLAGKLDRLALKRMASQLQSCLRSLHAKWKIAHGDLSPKNILITEEGRVTFLDWEFAQSQSDHSISHYGQYRGTVGFSGGKKGDETDPFAKDWQSLDACLIFLSEARGISQQPKHYWLAKIGKWNWLQRT